MNDEELFKTICECDFIYLSKLQKCPKCEKSIRFQKDIIFDYSKFFEYVIELQNKTNKCIDLIMDVFFNLWDRFDIMNNILKDFPINQSSTSMLISVMMNTFKYSNKIPVYLEFCDKSFDRMKGLGVSEEQISKYKKQYRDIDLDKYWGDLKTLGVTFPSSMFGPGRPQ